MPRNGESVRTARAERRAAAELWGADDTVLRLARWSAECDVLGPGRRAVLWVQGCPFRCDECVVPELLPFAGGDVRSVAEVVDFVLDAPDLDGVTLSGGEPFSQAAALIRVIDGVADSRPGLSVMSYTGHTLGWLQRHGSSAQRGLLDRLDILVDGPYVPARHTDLRWRGSDNQRVHLLTPRVADLATTLSDRGAWLEFDVDDDGAVTWSGIPPLGFRSIFEEAMAESGITLRVTD